MVHKDFRKALHIARSKLTALIEQRDKLDRQIASYKRTVASLAQMIDETEDSDIQLELNMYSLQEAIRTALQSSSAPLTQQQVRKRLKDLSFPIEEHKNPTASIHTTLRRMVTAGDATEDMVDGKKVFGWKGSSVPSLDDPENPLYKSGMRPFPTKK